MGASVVQDESGRVHVHVDDSSLVSISPVSQPVGASGALVEVLRVPLQVPPADGRPGIFLPVTRGQIVLGSSINAPATLTTRDLTMEVALVGYVGAQGIVIDRGVLSAGYPTRRLRVEAEEPYTALGVLARQLVDGAPDPTVTPPSFQVQLTGLFWS